MNTAAKTPVFPLVRHLSKYLTPVLYRLPVTANQITAASLVSGLAASWCILQAGYGWMVSAGLLFVVTYVLDNCDGEIARLKNQCSAFGMRFDSFVDWAVHTAFFVALGLGFSRSLGDDLWLWMGLIAGAGGTINYGIGIVLDVRENVDPEIRDSHYEPEGLRDWVMYIFRELTRADFCFIVLALAVFEFTWVLLPVGAIGSQIYWILQFVPPARDFHV